jgi:acetolactate synthase regulatory subunit
MALVKAHMNYELDLKAADDESKLEIWRGIKLMKEEGIVMKKYNITRQHSNEKRRDKVIVQGQRFKTLLKPHKHTFFKFADRNHKFVNKDDLLEDIDPLNSDEDLRAARTRGRKPVLVDFSVTQWGQLKFEKTPVAAKGMQFVNVDNLVDMSDFEEFKKKVAENIDNDFTNRFSEVNTTIDRESLILRKDVIQ